MAPSVRILIDAHMVGHRETGNESYVRGLVAGLASIGGLTVGAAVDSPTVAETLPSTIDILHLPSTNSWRRLFNDFASLSRAWRADIVHATYIVPYRLPCPSVVSVHDVSFRRYAEFFSRRDRLLFATLFPRSLRRAAAILTLSSHARDEINSFYPGHGDRLHVIPAAPGAWARPLDAGVVHDVLTRHGLRQPFLLAVGNLQPRKNLGRLVEAFRGLADRHPGVSLVIVGPSGFEASRVHDAIREHRLTDRVRWMGYLPDADLAALYNAAIALVYPSVYEGFGLPAVEAMACGCPVIAANTSSLPEVVGDAGFLVDPYDVPALTQVIERVIADEAFARSLRARGLARASTFSWRRSAEAAVAIYRDVLRSGHAAGRR